jgi:quinol monooxygenase YgiN
MNFDLNEIRALANCAFQKSRKSHSKADLNGVVHSLDPLRMRTAHGRSVFLDPETQHVLILLPKEWEWQVAVIRISLGRFEPDKYETVRQLLQESEKTLIPAIRGLEGNRAYYVGIDRENNSMTNVSVWDTRGNAEQMASLKAMLDLAIIFVGVGVRFERPITNHETLWTM